MQLLIHAGIKVNLQTTYLILWVFSCLKLDDCFISTMPRRHQISKTNTWWRHQMETSSASLASWVESTGDRWIPFTKASDDELFCFFDLRLSKQLSKQLRRRWFETPSRSLWRNCRSTIMDTTFAMLQSHQNTLDELANFNDRCRSWQTNSNDSSWSNDILFSANRPWQTKSNDSSWSHEILFSVNFQQYCMQRVVLNEWNIIWYGNDCTNQPKTKRRGLDQPLLF